ncbi:sigma-70 family RNA polymerase sigma factor [Sagittula sp. M10.9X]|uniref:Sigma-70 family RNA polymerase sigma factor n=1 Tax=Sagittula salina TaxID=2820268 RepID=A0A940MTI9_9RHOB|nr:sigma-70 family RNA polymerase sigma factor [Sagittula salina]
MLTALRHTAPCDPPPLAVPPRRRAQRIGTKDLRVPHDTTKAEDPAIWANALIRIRDHRDEAAFAALFCHFAPRIKGFLIRSGTDPALAEECAQDVLATAWRKAALFDPSRASAATWLFTIARNRRIDIARRQRRPEPQDLPWGPEPDPDQAELLGLQQETEYLGAALKALPKKQRDLIEKAYFGEMTHSEIAAETGLPLGTIKSRIRLALDRLRHALDVRDPR